MSTRKWSQTHIPWKISKKKHSEIILWRRIIMSHNNIRLNYILKSQMHIHLIEAARHTPYFTLEELNNWNWMHLHHHHQSIYSIRRRRTIRNWIHIKNHHSIFLRSNFTYRRKLHHYIQFVMERTLKRITEKRLQREVLKHQFLDLEQLGSTCNRNHPEDLHQYTRTFT